MQRTRVLMVLLTFTEIVLIGWLSSLNKGTALSWISNPFVYHVLRAIGQYVSSTVVLQGSPYEDLGVFGLVALASVASFVRLSFRKALSVICLLCIELTSAIMLFDPGEFYIHVTLFQVRYGILPWFTNADLLLVSASILIATLVWSAARSLSFTEIGASGVLLVGLNPDPQDGLGEWDFYLRRRSTRTLPMVPLLAIR